MLRRCPPHQPYRGVAQPGSALAWGASGRWFKSSRPDHWRPLIFFLFGRRSGASSFGFWATGSKLVAKVEIFRSGTPAPAPAPRAARSRASRPRRAVVLRAAAVGAVVGFFDVAAARLAASVLVALPLRQELRHRGVPDRERPMRPVEHRHRIRRHGDPAADQLQPFLHLALLASVLPLTASPVGRTTPPSNRPWKIVESADLTRSQDRSPVLPSAPRSSPASLDTRPS